MKTGSYDNAILQKALREYAKTLAPWAQSVAAYMLADVARRNAKQWKQHSKEMGAAMRYEVEQAPMGLMLRDFLQENVDLITSLPLQAAERVHELTVEGLSTGRRAEDIQKEIYATGHVTMNRARLIARTEVARTAAAMTMQRATYVGSEGYIWRTAGDANVRESHEEMEGKYVRWNSPPHLSDGTQTHAGMIYNCRCYAEVVLPEYTD